MAGEAGQGFAVVAEEVERLAERANAATKQIETLIKTIQNDTNEAVSAMEESTREVVEGSKLASQAGQTLGEIDHVSHRLADILQNIKVTTNQQARGAEALAKSMSEISATTQRTAEGTKLTAGSVSQLARLADDLRVSVSNFKLPNRGGSSSESSTIFRRYQSLAAQ
jgi:twitching motility protein PilJ